MQSFLWASILQSFRDTSSRFFWGGGWELSPFVVPLVFFFSLFALVVVVPFPPHCETFVLYWHGEHPSHQCPHASAVPGGARGGDRGRGPFKSHYSDKWHLVLRRMDPVLWAPSSSAGVDDWKMHIDFVRVVVDVLPNKSKTTMRRAFCCHSILHYFC